MFKTPAFTTKSKRLALVNSFVSSHDLTCHCNKPAVHCIHILIDQLKDELTTEDKQQIKQCLGEETTGQEDADGFDVGDLETLFAEKDFTEEEEPAG